MRTSILNLKSSFLFVATCFFMTWFRTISDDQELGHHYFRLRSLPTGLLTDADVSLNADIQAEVTYACSCGNEDIGRLGMFCLPISRHVSRVS